MNKRDVEDAYMLGNVAYQEFITEFEMEWNKPDIDMLLALDLFANRDIYGGSGDGSNLQTSDEYADGRDLELYQRPGMGAEDIPGSAGYEQDADDAVQLPV